MNKLNFLKTIKQIFSNFGINDLKIIQNDSSLFLVLPIDKEEEVPSYNLVVTFLDDDYLNINTYFNLRKLLKKEKEELINKCNNFNQESFLKFIIDDNKLIISYNMPEIDINDDQKVVKIMTIIPSLISDFYDDFKMYLM